jgi:site-specific recombinase XerD
VVDTASVQVSTPALKSKRSPLVARSERLKMFKNQYRPIRTGFYRDSSVENLKTEELVRRFSDWLICQRYSRTTLSTYNRVVRKFCMFWGRRKLSSVTHLDIRAFLIDASTRDLSADIMHRHIWALRCFFDFLCRGGVVDDVAPRLIRPRPVQRPLPKTLSEQNVKRLLSCERTRGYPFDGHRLRQENHPNSRQRS